MHSAAPTDKGSLAVYLWGSVLSPVQLGYPYTPDAFLLCALENLRHDISRIGDDSKLLLETIQAEILVSFYYLHSASPVQGCYHASGAASLALGAGLHSTCSLRHEQLPLCSLSDLQSTSRPATVTWGNAAHIDAFQAVLVINNCWVAVVGVPSTIPHWVSENWADRGTVQTGSTITAFLNGDDAPACSNVSLLVKASIFLERVVSFLTRTTTGPPPEPTVVASLNERIESFRAALPPLSGGGILLLTHALVDFAIVRLHAPYIHIVEQRRVKCLGAAARIVLGVGTVDLVDSACTIDPMLVSICTAVAHIYLDEIQVCGNESRRKPSETELETQLGSLMTVLASLSPYSSFYGGCWFYVSFH
ncbi:hypothetical protein B0H16DRAFT_1728471 [Mycena metata]|uniref:Uncharacterized protein n=1 Tax=Mycena metata TaxID=1033252 RepID=A0AAD7IF42_9AGAR|nr:hypothetical protein B0H16DRAFT_1728471 [Mycena metata]